MAAIFANPIRGLNICPRLFHGSILLFKLHTADHSINSLSAFFFLAGIAVTALKRNRLSLWVKRPGLKAVENDRNF